MQKKVTIITIVVVSLLFIGVSVGLYLLANSAYQKRSSDLTNQIQVVQTDLDALKMTKDSNNYTPTEVVKAFFNEVKIDSVETAKLYLSPEVQSMDIAATLKLGDDLANISTGDSFPEISGENMIVNMTFILPTEETTVRIFNLSRYNDVWKITGVTAE